MTFSDHITYTGRGLLHTADQRAYNAEARRIGWPFRICEYCGLETRAQCRQRDGGAPGWFENQGPVSCGPCRAAEYVSNTEIRAAKRGRSGEPFGPRENIK